MRYMEWFFYFKKPLFQNQKTGGFTLLELMVSLFLTGIFITLLTSCMVQVVKFLGVVAERTRQCQQIRTLCEILTADCQKLFLTPVKEFIELNLPSEVSGLILLRGLFEGGEYSAPYGELGICAVQYRFYPERGVICRSLWGTQKTRASLATETRLVDALSPQDVVLSRDLVRNVAQFSLHSLDIYGQKQASWIQGSSVGVECSVTFRSSHQRIPQTFHVRIPVLKLSSRVLTFR